MGLSQFPAAASGGKTRYMTTLTSGTSWTVPAGVNYVIATCIGGGGGGPANYWNGYAGSGGSTTFSTITAAGGPAGTSGGGSSYSNNNGVSAQANSGLGGSPMQSSATNAAYAVDYGGSGGVATGYINTTPGGSVTYSIGAGGGGAGGYPGGYNNSQGTMWYAGNGGSGRIDLEYWV
jgi:hypothetical protein